MKLVTCFIVVPPVDIQLEEVSRSEILKNSTKISLLCKTGVSNPISNITWDGLDDIENTLLTTESKEKEFGGYQLSQVRFHGRTMKVSITRIQPLTTFFKKTNCHQLIILQRKEGLIATFGGLYLYFVINLTAAEK